MALTVIDLKQHCNVTSDEDNDVLTRFLAAATSHLERLLGFKLTDTTALPDGPPADLELALLMLAAEWYENREASIVGVAMMAIPFGVEQIVNEHRTYTFWLAENG